MASVTVNSVPLTLKSISTKSLESTDFHNFVVVVCNNQFKNNV
jgi:hypothetical protein